MRFTDGFWLTLPNVEALYAKYAYEATVSDDGKTLSVLAASKPVVDRGVTINLPAFNIRLTSPGEGVIRVQAAHWKHAAIDPGFPLKEEPFGEASISGDKANFISGSLKAHISLKSGFNLTFENRQGAMTSINGKGIARYLLNSLSPVSSGAVGAFGASRTGLAYDEADSFIAVQLAMNIGEQIFGLGERFGAYVKNGQSLDMWNADGGTSSWQGYKDIPFYLTTSGYGVLVNNRGHVSFEIGTENTDAVQISVPGEMIDFLIIDGPTPKEIIGRYTTLTGRPALPPEWSYGLWLTTSFLTKYDDETVNSMIDGMLDRGIPLKVFHYDCFWMQGFHWMDFTWDKKYFPDPIHTIQRIHDKGVKVCVWINPYISQESSAYEYAVEHGYLLQNADGTPWHTDFWQTGMGIVDFTNPDARAWYQHQIGKLLDMGVDALKTDFGERVPVHGVKWFDGAKPSSMHNWYTQLYNSAVFEELERRKGVGNAVLFARSATVGGQQQPVHWGGDCESTFHGMAQTLRAGLSFTNSGFGFWSHDIGGFEGEQLDSAVYKRWVAFGLLGSHSRMHGSKQYRVPWLFDEHDHENGHVIPSGQSAVDVVKEFACLKDRLLPYIAQLGVEAHETGIPVMRSMLLEFPDDMTARSLDRQYMLGPSLLVAPVFDYSGKVTYYLPAGTWTNWFTSEVVRTKTGQWRTETHGYDTIPLWVRDGSIILERERETGATEDYRIIASVFLNRATHATATIIDRISNTAIVFEARKDSTGVHVNDSDTSGFTARLGNTGPLQMADNGAVTLKNDISES